MLSGACSRKMSGEAAIVREHLRQQSDDGRRNSRGIQELRWQGDEFCDGAVRSHRATFDLSRHPKRQWPRGGEGDAAVENPSPSDPSPVAGAQTSPARRAGHVACLAGRWPPIRSVLVRKRWPASSAATLAHFPSAGTSAARYLPLPSATHVISPAIDGAAARRCLTFTSPSRGSAGAAPSASTPCDIIHFGCSICSRDIRASIAGRGMAQGRRIHDA